MKRINRVQQYKTDVAFKTLVEGVNEGIYYIPKYQRNFRWTKGQVQELIRSLVKDYPIPPIYAYRNRDGQLEILDGQQRVMSFFFYYIGKFTKKNNAVDFRKLDTDGKKYIEALENKYELTNMYTILNPQDPKEEQIDVSYSRLPMDMKRRLDYTNITVIELRWEDSENRAADLQTIFKNLNKNGTLLEHQEVRNGVYDCAFYDMLRLLNTENENWRSIWGKNKSSVEEDMEFLLRLCTVKRYVSYKSGEFVIHNYTGKYVTWLDQFSEEAMNMNQEEIDEYRQSLEGFFTQFMLNKAVGPKKALLESIYVIYDKCGIDMKITETIISKIMSPQFKETAIQGTVKKNIMNERWKGVYATFKGLAEEGS